MFSLFCHRNQWRVLMFLKFLKRPWKKGATVLIKMKSQSLENIQELKIRREKGQVHTYAEDMFGFTYFAKAPSSGLPGLSQITFFFSVFLNFSFLISKQNYFGWSSWDFFGLETLEFASFQIKKKMTGTSHFSVNNFSFDELGNSNVKMFCWNVPNQLYPSLPFTTTQ